MIQTPVLSESSLSEPVVDQSETLCENYSQTNELKNAEEQFYKDFNEIMSHVQQGSDQGNGKDGCEEECAISNATNRNIETKEEEEECYHVIIHELISAMSDLSKPMDHCVLDSLIDELPKIKGVEYPSKEDCPDTCVRQSILLKLMTKVYEGVSRKCMETHCVPNDLYRDQIFLHEILTSSCCGDEDSNTSDGKDRSEPVSNKAKCTSDFLNFLHGVP